MYTLLIQRECKLLLVLLPDEDETNTFARSLAVCQVLEAMLICSSKDTTSGTGCNWNYFLVEFVIVYLILQDQSSFVGAESVNSIEICGDNDPSILQIVKIGTNLYYSLWYAILFLLASLSGSRVSEASTWSSPTAIVHTPEVKEPMWGSTNYHVGAL